ncbi:hypothetical protein GCM10010191_01890 [Actinomadura vinacea]|uniref:Uncharacterized protein n=1 Tax=Actinomadura vinacea TaxID=115336 RepID=A0ABP5VBD5_9ACTN
MAHKQCMPPLAEEGIGMEKQIVENDPQNPGTDSSEIFPHFKTTAHSKGSGDADVLIKK